MGSIGTGQSSLAIGIAFPILGGTGVALRFYTRWLHKMRERLMTGSRYQHGLVLSYETCGLEANTRKALRDRLLCLPFNE